MTKLKAELEIDSSDWERKLRKKLESSKRFQPVVFGCKDPMSKLVEFGMNNGGKVFSAKNPPAEFKEWVQNKYGVNGDKCEKLARREYYKIQSVGMPPMPFLRPAMHHVLRRISSQKDWFDRKENSTLELARLIAEEMKRISSENDLPMSATINENIFYGPGEGTEMSSYIRSMPSDVMARDDVNSKDEVKKNKGSKR